MATERLIIGDDANRRRGTTAQARGTSAERHVEGMCRIYAAEGRAFIDRLHVPTRGGARARIIAGRAPIDFGGVLSPSGRAVFAELKSTDAGRRDLPIGAMGVRGIGPGQVEALAQRGRAGALSVLLWWRGETLGVCRWSVLEGFMLAGKPLPPAACRWLNPMSFDWLPEALVLDQASGEAHQ